jgi:hypothetical protein
MKSMGDFLRRWGEEMGGKGEVECKGCLLFGKSTDDIRLLAATFTTSSLLIMRRLLRYH